MSTGSNTPPPSPPRDDTKAPGRSRRAFLVGGNAMGARIRAYDWSHSPLGDPDGWPPALQALISVLLGSKQPMFIAWGPEQTLLYNDAYGEVLGRKHPDALGQPFLAVWAEIRDDLLPIVEQAYAGEPVHMDDIMLVMHRHGYPEETHFAFSYTPVRDEAGEVAGFFCPCVETTAQVLADRRLVEETRRQRRLFEQAPGFIAILQGPEHVFEFANRAFSRLAGGRDLTGRSVREAFPDLAGQNFYEWLDQVYRSGERLIASQMPIRLQASPDAAPAERFIDFIYEPVINEAGQVTGIFVEGHDVTEQQRAQEALRASETQLSALAQALPNLVWTTTPDGRVDWVNDRFLEYAGLPLDGLLGEGWVALVHPDDRATVAARWHSAMRTGSRYETEMRLRNAAGHYRWHITRGVPVRDERGHTVRWIGTNTDIEDQKLVADKLRQLNETLEQRVEERTVERDRVWRNSRDLLVVAGADGRIHAVNPAWTEITGYRVDEAEGRSVLDFIWPEDVELTRRAHEQAASRRHLTNFENRYRHRDGTPRWISWYTSFEHDIVYGYGRHITAEKEQAQALKQAEEQLRQAQKMEAVGQLTGGIAHDFNNLLGGIIGSLDLMQARMAQGRSDSLARYVQSAMSSAQRAASLTHRLLAFARRQPLDPRPVNANQLVSGMEDLLCRTIGPQYDIRISHAAGLWTTRCDPYQLESAILNLALNARDAMPDGGTLHIETRNAYFDHALAAVQGDLAPGEYVAIGIADSGIGMSAEVAARAIEPFFTTKGQGQGTGLGLSMVYGFARQSEGHLRIHSAPGEGTTVNLYLPRHQAQPERPPAETALPLPSAAAGASVLLVEDDPVIRELLVEVLEELGCRTRVASDGLSGLELLHAHRPPDLLVTDIGLPGLNGRQLAARARESHPGLKILFITGYAENATLANGFLEPGMEMITKPFEIAAFAGKVHSLIRED